jgi:hypothetical protein
VLGRGRLAKACRFDCTTSVSKLVARHPQHRREIATCAERATLACKYGGAHLRIGIELVNGAEQRGQ